MANGLATSQETAQLSKLDQEILRLQEEIAKTNSALGGNRKSMASVMGKGAAEDFFGKRQELAGGFRERRSNLERQLSALQGQRNQLKAGIQARVLAEQRALTAKLPEADQARVVEAGQNPQAIQGEIEQAKAGLVQAVETGDPASVLSASLELRTLAGQADQALGFGSEGPAQQEAMGLIRETVPRVMQGAIQPAPRQEEPGPFTSSPPTPGELQAAGGLQEAQRAEAPFPEPVPNVPGEGLADTLQRIAPAGGPVSVREGTLLNSGQGPIQAPPGQQLVFRGSGDQIEAGSAPIGTPGSQQFTSAFRPNAELTRRLQAPQAGTVQPGQSEPAPVPDNVQPAPAAPPPQARAPSVLGRLRELGARLPEVNQVQPEMAVGILRPAPTPTPQAQPQAAAPQPDPLVQQRQAAEQMAARLAAQGRSREEITQVLVQNFPSLAQF